MFESLELNKMRESLKRRTYAEAEAMFNYGSISQVEWAEYQRIWRNSTFRYSHLAEQYQEVNENEK